MRPSAHLTVSYGGTNRVYDITEDQMYHSLSAGQNLPIQAGSVATLNFQMRVPDRAVPNIPFQSTIKIHDQNGEVLSCFTANSVVKTY